MIKVKAFVLNQIADIRIYGVRELFRKFFLTIKILAQIPIYIIAIAPCIFIRLIRSWIIVRIEKFPTSNFGSLMEFPSVYQIRKKLNIDLPKKKFFDFVYIDYKNKIYNRQLVKMWNRKFNFLSGYLLDPISRVNKLLPGWRMHTIDALNTRSTRDVDNLVAKYQPLNFISEEEIYGKKMLSKIGLKDGDRFICLIVRDAAYQKKKISPRYRDWSYHDHRNQEVNNYLLASEELAKRGYYVFRMGAVVEKEFTSSNKKIIDYANSNFRSDFMDVYLAAKCFFCISTGLGFDYLPYFFKRPIVFSDMVPIGDLHTMSEQNMHITKHHVLKKEKRRLSMSEIFSHGVGFAYDNKIFKEKGIELVDNTPEEIKDLVIEMIEHLEFNKKLSPESEELQKSFKKLYATNIKRFSKESDGKNVLLMRGKTKTKTIMHGTIRSRFGSKFLEKNKDWLN